MSECPSREKNLKKCNCTYDCSKKGNCCECVRYHRSMGEFPACFFSKQAEATYDRSLEALIKDRGR
jgi:hypothetical protein